jgi:signal transduction histidine kinase/CheY-like chemotaxis protein
MSALKNGSVDSIICTQPAATWILNRNRASDYVVSAFGNGTFNVVCACTSDTDGNTLRGILNKTITVDGSYIQHLITGDTLQDSADFSTIFDRLPVSWTAMFASVAGLMLAVAIVAIIIILRRRQAERKLAARQAELAAEIETNKARRAFFGTISHDMRTPLNGIVGFADLALESGDPSEMKKYLQKIRTSGSVLSSLVSDTLIMSRVENGKYVLHPAPCEASDILDGVIEPVRKIAEEKGVRFEENVSGVCHRRVIADRLSIQKVLLNLLTNAVKFTQPGGTVKMECHYDPKDGAEPDSVIVISDTGIGMSPEFLPHVFEPFAQENAEAGDKTGSGMGLSIVKSIVDAMGGRISVKSTKGKGTAFTVRMHLQEAEEQPAAKSSEEKKDYSVLRGKKALICEDNALNLEIISTILKRQGMETVGRKNGREGCDAFRESRPGTFDIIFLDLRMPAMGGLEAAREIRAMERSDAKIVPIYAVSADAYPENIADSTEAGMNGHISKPIDAAALLRTAAEAVAGGPA